MEPQYASGRGYIPSLDGLRAVAIGIVFVGHSRILPQVPGGFGVTIFFFLSGYLITTLLVREWDRYGGIDFRAFYLRRFVRLMPALLVTMALGIGLALAGLTEGDLAPGAIVSQVLFYYNVYAQLPDPAGSVQGFGILWSLSVEEHFYLIWPFAITFILAGRAKLWKLGVVLAAVLAWRYVSFLGLDRGEYAIYISTDTRIDSLLYGCLLSLMVARGTLPRDPEAGGRMYALLGLSAAVILATFVLRDEVFRSTLRYTLQGIAMMPLFYYAVHRPDLWLFRPLNSWPMRRIGIYSYTLYLVHYVIIYTLIHAGFPEGSAIVFVIAAVLSIAWSALVYATVERPLQQLRARLAPQAS
ncbi:acyltransferase family protein [Rhodobacterales bacterium HKCCE2091]|nr:acyltransferase family protein [Rhodobacterales bacterium HKCCE2091]